MSDAETTRPATRQTVWVILHTDGSEDDPLAIVANRADALAIVRSAAFREFQHDVAVPFMGGTAPDDWVEPFWVDDFLIRVDRLGEPNPHDIPYCSYRVICREVR